MHPIFLNYIHILIIAVHFLLTPIRRKYILSAVHDSYIRKPLFHRTHRQNEGRSSHHASLCSSQSLFRKRLTIHRSVLLHRRLQRFFGSYIFHFMECLIQSRTDQVGHTCIKDGKFLPCSLFYIEDFGYQRTTLTYHCTSQFKMQCLIRTQFQLSGIGSKVILEIRDSLTVGVSVINTQTTTYIDMFYQNSSCFQFVLQLIDTIAEATKSPISRICEPM